MKQEKLIIGLLLIAVLYSCSSGLKPDANFGAYYTEIKSGDTFEEFSRTGPFSDIIIDLGEKNGKLIFWRGASYLPFWENIKKERFYFDEVIPRSGNGEGMMPDRVNTYSHVKIIENSPNFVLIHWRYLRSFSQGNPDVGVSPEGFVDEYFKIYPNGRISREVRPGQAKTNDWNNPGNILSQEIEVNKKGLISSEAVRLGTEQKEIKVTGSKEIEQIDLKPQMALNFDEGLGEITTEVKTGKELIVDGRKVLWRQGISGTCLQFDGYNTEINLPTDLNSISEEISLQAFFAIGAYPWSWCPIIQMCDDVPEEVEAGRKFGNYTVNIKKEKDRGFFLGINGEGNPGFKLNVGGSWEELVADVVLKRRQWYLLTATYSARDGIMKIYLDDRLVGSKRMRGKAIVLSDSSLRIGKGKPRRPINPVRRNTFPGQYAFDGLIDEVKVFDKRIPDEGISEYFNNSLAAQAEVDMDERILPAGEDVKTFGAVYDHLKYYDIWDNLWCFSDHPDVVVGFDNNPSKFVFWRGVSYIPMMVNEKGQWYSNEFNETWGTSGGDGCQEPMSDKGNYFTYARIIENTPARVVVQYRFPLADVNLVKANYVEETGWYDVADWYYYIYPDGIAVKKKHLWTSGDRNHEWQESMAIFGPDQHPEQIIEKKNTVTMMDMEGNQQNYHWTKAPPPNVDLPENQCIQIVNYTGDYDPITIGEAFESSNVYGGELTPYSVFPTWNHWPVAQMPSDGRYANFADRTGHSSLTHVYLPVYDAAFGNKPFYEKLLMEAMLETEKTDLVTLARSWNHAPDIGLIGEGKVKYDKSQRAYIIEDYQDKVEVEIKADEEHPVYNVCLVLKDWGRQKASEITVNGNNVDSKQGIERDTNGTYKLVIWIEIISKEQVSVIISD